MDFCLLASKSHLSPHTLKSWGVSSKLRCLELNSREVSAGSWSPNAKDRSSNHFSTACAQIVGGKLGIAMPGIEFTRGKRWKQEAQTQKIGPETFCPPHALKSWGVSSELRCLELNSRRVSAGSGSPTARDRPESSISEI